MIRNNSQVILYFYSIFLILFLSLTNQYFDYQESIIFGGADGEYYINISKSFPGLAESEMMPIHAERFFFYYIFGFFSKLLNIEVYYVYRFFVFIILGLVNIFLILICKSKNLDLRLTLIILSLINLNPYISRLNIAVPTVVNDLIFIFGLTLFLYSLESRKTKILITSLIILFFARQTSIAIIISLIFTKFVYRENFFFNNKKIFLIILGFFFIYFINYQYSSHVFNDPSYRWEQYSPEMRLFGFFLQDVAIGQKLLFLTLPFLSFFPLFLYIFIFRKLKKITFSLPEDPKIFFYLFICLLIVLQPILSGFLVTGRNIIRLTTLAYIPIIFLLVNASVFIELKNKVINVFFYFFVVTWSFHPTFSNIKFFKYLSKGLKSFF
jgi:hypothetical protein